MTKRGACGVNEILFATLMSIPLIGWAQSVRVESDAGVSSLLSAAARDLEKGKAQGRSIAVLASSTGGALVRLCRGEIVIAGAGRAANRAERDLCAQERVELVELPVATDTVVLVSNPNNTWARQLTVADLKRAWLDAPGKATSWKQINGAWPDIPLKLYGPAPRTGLAAYVRIALTEGSIDSERPALRTDINTTEVLSLVAEGVARDGAGLGLLDRVTYEANMKRVRLVPMEGLPAFPLYVYTSAKALEDAGTRAYLEYLLANGASLAVRAGLGALAPAAYESGRQRLSVKR